MIPRPLLSAFLIVVIARLLLIVVVITILKQLAFLFLLKLDLLVLFINILTLPPLAIVSFGVLLCAFPHRIARARSYLPSFDQIYPFIRHILSL